MFKIQLILVLLIQHVQQNSGDVFASMSQMVKLIDTEEILIKDLTKYIDDYQEAIKYMKLSVLSKLFHQF
jgi:hypothetical protein